MTTGPIPEASRPARVGGERVDPSCVADERRSLTEYLEWHRRTFELKCAGLGQAQLSELSVPPSGMSLHGLLRHLTGVERWWFRQQFAGEDLPILYYSDDDPNQDFERLDGDVEEAFALWRAECERSREIAMAAESMEQQGTRLGTGEPFTLRWLMLRMITEYARHLGHADLLRERIDGEVGE
ncbi:DinB family protein [Amycolatopsis sp. NPDC058986]|uniref:DinB family protein n=1 Tax=unclassified Amycolatopsis TaxID=2618356 RepID=UPI00366ED49A